MCPHRKFPPPPIERFKHGAVWHVVLEECGRDTAKRDYEDMAHDYARLNVLVLLTAPWREWPANENYYWRSRLLVGDRQKRAVVDIMRDFRRLLLQTPPVLRNWHKSLDVGLFEKRRRHLVWESQVDLIVI